MIGVNCHLPAKISDDGWDDARTLLASIPKGTAIRTDLLFHEWAWNKDLDYGLENIHAKLDLLAPVGGVLIVGLTPIPWPGSIGWVTFGPNGFVLDTDIPALAEKFARMVGHIRAKWKALGRKEADLWFQIGNEPGAGHPGGWEPLPRGTWWSVHGDLYVACLKKARFGYAKVIAPALSFLDEDARQREIETATPILKALRPHVDYFAVHSRSYAPSLGGDDWGREAARVLKERLDLAASFGKPAVCTELYAAQGDYSGSTEAAVAGLVKAVPSSVFACLYRIGPGPTDPTFELPTKAFFSAVSQRAGE